MKTIIVKSQAEFDAIKQVDADMEVVCECKIELRRQFDVFGVLRGSFDCSFGFSVVARGSSSVEAWGSSRVVARESSSVVARGSSRVEAWESSRVEAWGSSRVEAWESSRVEAWESSSVVARGSSRVEAWESSRVEAWESSSVVARGSSSVVARGSSSVVARGSSSVEAWGSSRVEAWVRATVQIFGGLKISLNGYSAGIVDAETKVKVSKSKTAYLCRVKKCGWFDNNGIKKTKIVTLFKRVSSEWKTQEGTPKETKWDVGAVLEHPNWNPESGECGAGKYHACSRAYFCDEFRGKQGDRYIAIQVKAADLFEWKNPTYPHKIAFRKCKVLYECDRWGEKIEDRKELAK